MIRYVKREDLEVKKYDLCVEDAMQSRIYAFSWYLDIVADNWDVLVLNDYEAVMPIPWRKKYFIKYVYQPLWVLELGIFSKERVDENEFLVVLFDEFKYVDFRANSQNSFSMFEQNRIEKQFQVLSLKTSFDSVFSKYKKDRKKDINKAVKSDLTEKWNDHSENLIKLYKDNVGKRIKEIKDADYLTLSSLIKLCIDKRKGEVLSIYTKNNELVASGFFVKDKKRVSILVSSTDFKNRKNGANTFLINSAIFKYKTMFEEFGFGGSSIKSIANYFKSFGAKTEMYQQLKYSNLSRLIRFFKP